MTENEIKNKVQIIVAAHKQYPMPTDAIYLPVQVGATGKEPLGYATDDTGDNISAENPSFCELTGLYWAWKNLEADHIGLAHYRRHFSVRASAKDPFQNILSSEQLLPLLEKHKIILPRKRKYYIESLYSHYAHTHYASHLDLSREIIADKYPDFLPAYDTAVGRIWGYMFNMCIMPRDLLGQYCQWLFDILFALRERGCGKNLDAFQGRFYGRVSEILFNVWLEKMISDGVLQSADIKEIPVIYMEKVNWWKKGTAFLRAKFFRKKYNKSF